MPFYRKKPIVIEAQQLPEPKPSQYGEFLRIALWCEGEVFYDRDHGKPDNLKRYIVIRTLEGDHTAWPTDFIIKGVKGEFYPCKPDIFEATYEPVEENSDQP